MRSEYSVKTEQYKRILIEASLGGSEYEQAKRNAEQALEELRDQEDKLLLIALKACLASRKTYEDMMTFLNGERYYGKAGEYETVNTRNGMQYIKRKFRETFNALDQKKAQMDAHSEVHSDEERYELWNTARVLMKDESNVRTRMLVAIKESRRTYEEILAYARAARNNVS